MVPPVEALPSSCENLKYKMPSTIGKDVKLDATKETGARWFEIGGIESTAVGMNTLKGGDPHLNAEGNLKGSSKSVTGKRAKERLLTFVRVHMIRNNGALKRPSRKCSNASRKQ